MDTAQREGLLEIVANLARFHREHEKFYARAPLRQALDLQTTSGTLKALAERWSSASPLESPQPSPYAGASDLNDERAIEASGVLFMEDGRVPAEIERIRGELELTAQASRESAEWLATAMETARGVAAALLPFAALTGLLAERHSIIAHDRQNASMLLLISRQLSRAGEILDRVDFAPAALREDLAGSRIASSYLFSAAELIDQAADLEAQTAVLVHQNERKWRVFSGRVAEMTSGVTTDREP